MWFVTNFFRIDFFIKWAYFFIKFAENGSFLSVWLYWNNKEYTPLGGSLDLLVVKDYGKTSHRKKWEEKLLPNPEYHILDESRFYTVSQNEIWDTERFRNWLISIEAKVEDFNNSFKSNWNFPGICQFAHWGHFKSLFSRSQLIASWNELMIGDGMSCIPTRAQVLNVQSEAARRLQ